MSDPLSIESLLARIQREAKGFAVPERAAAPRRTPLTLATAQGEVEARLEALERRFDSAMKAQGDTVAQLQASLQNAAIAIELQQTRVAAVDRAQGDIRILREQLRVLAASLTPLPPEEKQEAEQGLLAAEPFAAKPFAAAPLAQGDVSGWRLLLLENGDRFLNDCYRVLLDRDIDEAGLQGYRGMREGGRIRLEVLCDIVLSPEFGKRGIALEAVLADACSGYRLMRRLERTPLRFLAPFMRRRLQRQENNIRADAAADAAIESRDAVAALTGSLGLTVNPDGEGVAFAHDVVLDAFYLAFEDEMRGPVDEIKAGLGVYLERVAQVKALCDGPVLDLGCGRGEWLSLLAESGYGARGIDLSPTMVRLCRERGLDVTESDVVSALRAASPESLAFISSFHLIEHLPFPALFVMFQESFRALQPGGAILFETPNPENALVGSHTFYHDPTHKRPLTPSSMMFLARFHGFENIEIVRLRPYPPEALVRVDSQAADRLNGHLYGPQDYAILARKPMAGPDGAEASGA